MGWRGCALQRGGRGECASIQCLRAPCARVCACWVGCRVRCRCWRQSRACGCACVHAHEPKLSAVHGRACGRRTHASMSGRTHARTHAPAHARTRARTHACTLAHAHACTHVHAHSRVWHPWQKHTHRVELQDVQSFIAILLMRVVLQRVKRAAVEVGWGQACVRARGMRTLENTTHAHCSTGGRRTHLIHQQRPAVPGGPARGRHEEGC